MKKIILIITAVICIYYCSDITGNSNNKEKIDLTHYFPLKIGNTWTYESVSTEWTFVQRMIMDTLRGDDGKLYYKAIYGIQNFPPDGWFYEYYIWDEQGLFNYLCGIEDTCKDHSGNIIPPFGELYIKSFAYEGEEWNPATDLNPNGSMIKFNLIDSLPYSYQLDSYNVDTMFNSVAVLSTFQIIDNDTIKGLNFYAPDFGLFRQFTIQNSDTIYKLNLINYHLN